MHQNFYAHSLARRVELACESFLKDHPVIKAAKPATRRRKP
jgi:hypothetical protein